MLACDEKDLRIKAVAPDCFILINKNNDKNALFFNDAVCHSFFSTDEIKEFLKQNNITI